MTFDLNGETIKAEVDQRQTLHSKFPLMKLPSMVTKRSVAKQQARRTPPHQHFPCVLRILPIAK